MFEYYCKVERVVDGDTIDVNIDLGFDVCTKQRVRLLGIDTPESRTFDKEGNEINCNTRLVEEGHARPYMGGKKVPWIIK
mgnify:CR=1 FL=1